MPSIINHNQHRHNNMALARIFHQMADCYRYLGSSERFRAQAYERVASVLHNMNEDISLYASDIKTLDQIGGIGESIAAKILEYLKTGRIATFEKLKKKLPFKLLELMDISGFGPATLKLLHEKKNINDRNDLLKALSQNELNDLPGFGEKRILNMKRALKVQDVKTRMPYEHAFQTAIRLLQAIRLMPGVRRAELAGSLRRKKETIGDIDILIAADTRKRNSIVKSVISMPEVVKVLAKGNTKASVLILGEHEVQVDIRLVHEYEFGSAWLYFTGSKEHNIKLRTMARNKGYRISEYGLYDLVTKKRVAGETEESMYRHLGLRYIVPEQRLGRNEIEKAKLTDAVNSL